jgi:hypothetical protein
MRVELSARIYPIIAAGILGTGCVLHAEDDEPLREPSAVEAFNNINKIKMMAQDAAVSLLAEDEEFVLRQSWWGGSIAPGKAKLHPVQLFKRNSYCFLLAVPDRRAELNLNIYDSDGQLVPTRHTEIGGSNIVTLTMSPSVTGMFFVRVSLKRNIDAPQDYALIYAFR